MKKRLAVLLSAVLALTMFGGQFAFAASGDQFTDVKASDWFKPDVDYVAENDYMIGTSDTTFEPQSNLTRAMFATILARYDGAEVDNSKPTIFTDVEVDQWFTGSIGWANEKKIVEGRGNNIFAPADFITRQELAVMVERYITYVESTTDKVHVTPGVAIPFTDADQISDYAKSAMDKAVIHGLIIGYPDKSVKPLQNITRAETAAVIHRIKWKNRDGRESYVLTYKDGENETKIDVPVGQLVIVGKDVPTPVDPNGGTFIGWTKPGEDGVTPDPTGTIYHPGDKIMLEDDTVLVPVFSDGKDEHVVTLIDATDDKELGKDTVAAGDTYTVPAGPAKSGYTFKEWNTSKDGKGTTYTPNAKIELTADLTLYAIYKKNSGGGGGGIETHDYEVKASLTAADLATLELSKTYTKVSATENDPVLDTVAKDLVSGENADAILGAVDAALTVLKRDKITDDVVVAGKTYVVETTKEGVVSVKEKDGEQVDLSKVLTQEQALYTFRMAGLKAATGITSDKWDEYVMECSPEKLFEVVGKDLKLRDAAAYTNIIINTVNKAVALHQELGSEFVYATALKNAAGWADALPTPIVTGAYTVDEKTIPDQSTVTYVNGQAGAHYSDILKDTNGILVDLMKDKNINEPYIVFSNNGEELGTPDAFVDWINARTSRMLTNSSWNAIFKAIAETTDKPIYGTYKLELTVTKTK